MRVLVLGAGLMGAQIGCEYALGGHDVTLTARRIELVEERVERTLETARRHGLFGEASLDQARARVEVAADPHHGGWDVVVESVPEDLELKGRLLRPYSDASPEAVLASNASSLSITALGDAAGAPERTVGTHYWNPPLLMPLVEVVPGERTDPAVVARVRAVLEGLGKRPILVERDVPGFIWNRLQFALLRECVWLVENGVASADAVDEVVRHGNARRWRHVGPFAAVALGGIETWNRAGENLVAQLSRAERLPDLRRFVRDPGELREVAERRDRALAQELVAERSPA